MDLKKALLCLATITTLSSLHSMAPAPVAAALPAQPVAQPVVVATPPAAPVAAAKPIVQAPVAPVAAIKKVSPSYFQLGKEFISQHGTQITWTALAVGVVGYIGYGIYLDIKINSHDSFWHWVVHHNKNGYIDSLDLFEIINARYSQLNALHPLTAVFALSHDVEKEIQDCLTLRGILNTLSRFKIEGLLSENKTTLDKKLEHLYILKLALYAFSGETRTRCRKALNI